MSRSVVICIGAIVVALLGMMTMIAGFPKLYSPYSFTVVLPAFFIYSLDLPAWLFPVASVVPIILLYLVWVLVLVRPPYRIAKIAKGLAVLLVLLSITFNLVAFKNGVKYQGELHTYVMYAYNIMFILMLAIVTWLNSSKSTLINSTCFAVILFSWLGWVAFPWLGELI